MSGCVSVCLCCEHMTVDFDIEKKENEIVRD